MEQIRDILERIRAGTLSVEEGLRALKWAPYEDLGYARTDTHRQLRRGAPEVIFCPGKTPDQVAEIATRLFAHHDVVLATRATPEQFAAVAARHPQAIYHEPARLIELRREPRPEPPADRKPVLVIAAGTADLPVAEEAAVTAECLGERVNRLYDCGVAGLHRLLDHRDLLDTAGVIIVVAGMDGALPSVVGGLVEQPVIAVPTSIGYGASFGGVAALLTMLNSCAEGVVVVNIDNGFGAGRFAHRINR